MIIDSSRCLNSCAAIFALSPYRICIDQDSAFLPAVHSAQSYDQFRLHYSQIEIVAVAEKVRARLDVHHFAWPFAPQY
jgi:hypothetical protein